MLKSFLNTRWSPTKVNKVKQRNSFMYETLQYIPKSPLCHKLMKRLKRSTSSLGNYPKV